MASDDPNNGRNSYPPHSIPLQDLESPGQGRIRALSDRGRDWMRHRSSQSGGGYSPIIERDGSPQRPRLGPRLTIPDDANDPQQNTQPTPVSPIDGAALQAAFAGLSFGPDPFGPPSHVSFTPSRLSLRTIPDDESTLERDEFEDYFPSEADTTPLATHLQPVAGSPLTSTPTGQRHDRNSRRQSVRFTTPAASPAGARLGDDLSQMEAGTRSPGHGRQHSVSLRRSLSPNTAGTTLQRAGTIVRNMSQRIVNISNEQDVVESTLRRKSSAGLQSSEMPSLGEGTVDVDGSADTQGPEKSPIHKIADFTPAHDLPPRPPPNPFKGKSFGIFPPDSTIRMRLADLFMKPFTEPFILALIAVQVILLAFDSSHSVYDVPRAAKWGTKVDWGLFVLFVIYSIEIVCRSIISGFIFNPVEYSTIDRKVGLRQAVQNKFSSLFGPQKPLRTVRTGLSDFDSFGPGQPGIIRSFTSNVMERSGTVKDKTRARMAHRAYLRHSFNRLDFIAVVSFWISFALAVFGLQNQHQIYVFRMLSCLRILRLLWITNGTAVILRSLKRSAPLLANVAILIGFFWLLFAIIGLQSFKSSLLRRCVWSDPEDASNTWTSAQFCGGWLDQNYTTQPWLLPDGVTKGPSYKGFICPVNSKCIEGEGAYNGTVSFDNIFQSIELVFVVMTSNTFSDLLYNLTMTDYLSAAIFFAAGIVVLFFWLVSLLIAVITSSFQVIREEGRASAFTGEAQGPGVADPQDTPSPQRRIPPLKRIYDKSYWVWISIITFGLLVQCLRSAGMSSSRARFIDGSETVVTFVLIFEIIFRFIADWRRFFRSNGSYNWRNLTDLLLAIATGIIQLPPIHDSGTPYAWLTVFQILRIYRVVLAVSITRELTLVVFKNITALGNQIFFTFLLTFLAAILAAEMFRGTLPQIDAEDEEIRTTFQSIFNSFLGMYQILSSENWTDIMYHVTAYARAYNTAWMGAAFFILWFILANFIVLNMFIAVIQENFDISEDEKRLKQVQAFLELKDVGSSTGNLSLSTIFKYGLVSGRRRDPLAFGTAATEMLLKDAVVKDFLDQQEQETEIEPQDLGIRPTLGSAPTAVVGTGAFSSWWGSLVSRIRNREPNPFYSSIEFSRAYEDLDPRTMAKEVMSAREKRKRAQRDYLQKHPKYNVSLFIFKPHNPLRKLCQRIVGPGRGGDRIEGVAPSPPIWFAFSAFIYAAIVAMVILACVTTPLYQKEYFEIHRFSVKNWFVYSDMGFALLFTVEAVIKIVADGFFFTPNAYFRGSWGMIDGVVLLTLWINIGTAFANEGQVSRAVGAFKALRALRLLNVSDSARNNFHAVIVRGGWKVISAAFVSLSFLLPFAIYGTNLFLGKMVSCNDGNTSFTGLDDCVDEYMSSPYNWNVWAPRQASNSYFSFDNFGSSLFILFQIVSQEGWTDVMWQAQSITGKFTQPQPFASQGNAVYFVVFNLLGAVFVLTLFVSVFMRNYTEQTGVAFLTSEQRAWLELRKLLRQISPSKRPVSTKQRQDWKEWCYKRAIRKSGTWQRFVTGSLLAFVVLLCLEWYPESHVWDRIRDYLFLLLTLVFLVNIGIRIFGLSWRRFRTSAWDFYSLFSVSGTFVTTIIVIAQHNVWAIDRIHKLCLISILFLLIPRNNQLDQLFKTAVASLPLILNLLATWFVLFLAFAIALTQAFGLTRFNQNENSNVNFRNVPKALILLFRMSVGEGWNQIMEDLAEVRPPYCVTAPAGNAFDSDCGSPEWARTLLIFWNILSMYIFVNLFVSLIYESFSYVYQRSSGLSVISREEIRRFKQAWAEFDPEGHGYISKEQFPRLLGELSGVFEMRIYDGDFSVKRIVEDCSRLKRVSGLPFEGQDPEVEIILSRLNERLNSLPREEIRFRRARMNKFYEEVLVSADPDLGISFTSLLIILAHYKVINDNKSLRLQEFLRRRARLQRVDEAVRRNIVKGFFDTVYWSRKFRAHRQHKSDAVMTTIPQFNVPAIYVDDEETHEGASIHNPFDPEYSLSPGVRTPTTSESDAGHGSERDIHTPTPLRTDFDTRLNRQLSASSIQMTPTASPIRIQVHRHAESSASDNWQLAEAISRPVSPLGVERAEDTSRSRANSSVSAQDVLEVLDNSAWGESIRRSFTMKRKSDESGGKARKE